MTIPNKFNPFGISRNKNKMPTDKLDFYAPFETDVNDVIHGLQGTIGYSSYYQIIQSNNEIGNYLQCTNTSNTASRALYYNNSENLLQYGTGDFSISFWIQAPNWNSYSQNCVFSKKGNDWSQGIVLYRDGNYSNCLNCRTGSIAGMFPTSNFVSAKWVHWVLIRSNGTLYWYKNGVLDNTRTFSGIDDVTNTSQKIYIGWNTTWTTTGYFNIKALRIYGKALTLDEIGLLSNEFGEIIYEIIASDQSYTFSPVNSSSVSISYSSGGTVNSFEIISGSLPSNISFNTSTGTFTGIASTDADHTYNLVIRMSGSDVMTKDINYTIYTRATSTLTAPSPQTFNFTTESQEIVKFTCTRENEQVIGTIYSGSLPSGMILVGISNDLYIQSSGNQTEAVNTSLVVGLTTNYHPEPVYVTCNVNLALNQISASNQAFTFYAGDGVVTKKLNYTSEKSITPVYSLNGTLPSGVTFDSSTGEFTSDGTQSTQETQTVQVTISSSTGCSTPAVITVTLNVYLGESPIPDDYIAYVSCSGYSQTAETGQSLTYYNTSASNFTTYGGIKCFDTTNATRYIRLTENSINQGKSLPRSYSCWLATTADLSQYHVMRGIAIGQFTWYSELCSPNNTSSDGKMNHVAAGGFGRDTDTGVSIIGNVWMHYIQNYYADQKTEVFINGERVFGPTNIGTININNQTLSLGCPTTSTSNPFRGYIAGARLWNRTLTAIEAQKLANEYKYVHMNDQTFSFNAADGVTSQALDIYSNDKENVNYILSGTLPNGITFDTTSGIFTSDGTQTSNQNVEVIVSAVFSNDLNTAVDVANVTLNVIGQEVEIPTSGLVFYASLSSVANTAETGQSLSYHNSPSATVIDGIECLYFDSTDGISTTDIENLPSGNSPFTASMWVCMKDLSEITSDANTNNTVFSFGNPSFYASPFFGWHGGTSGYFYGTWGRDLYTRITPNYNVWTNLMLTYDGSTLKFYLNGNVIASSTFNINVSYGGLYIGSHCDRSYFYGYLRDARLYNRVLTDDEMSLLVHEFDVTNPIITDSLTMYMPMKDNLNAFIGTPLSSVMTNPPTATVEDGIKCYYFDGSNCLYGDDASYFTTFNSSDAPHCTLCYWFKYDTTSQLERYAAQIGYQDNDYSACIHYNLTWNDAPQICQSQYGHWTEPLILGSEAANGWHLYVIRVQTWDFGEGEYWIYQDGYVNSTEYEGSGRGSTWGNFCMHPMIAIGGQVSLTNHSTGNIDCIKGWYTGIRLYNKVLSAEEIAAIAAEIPTSN